MAEKPQFDAAGYFESQGLKFKGVDPEGKALVEDESGQKGTYDVKSLLKSEGLDENADITYNTHEDPLNESPVGVIDRLKLSFGNTKGSVAYLKSKFQDATVDSRGDLVVKDQGAWKRVDLDGLGDDEGWKVSEMLGDVADIGGDALVGAGGLAGAIGGGGIASVGTAAAGSGVAGGIKNVLGRVAGTYDATPSEFVKDVLIDTAMGMAGEGIVLGGKAFVGPALKRGFTKLSNLGEASQDILAKTFAAADPETGAGTFRTIMQRGREIVDGMTSVNDRAAKMASSRGAQGAEAGVSETATELAGKILYKDTVDAAKPLVTDIQSNLSNFYEKEIQGAFKESLDANAFQEAKANVKQYGAEALNQVNAFFNESGLLTEISERTAKTSRKATSNSSIARTVSRNGEEPVSSTLQSMQKGTTNSQSTVRSEVNRAQVSPKALVKWANARGNTVATEESMKPLAKALNDVKQIAEGLSTRGVKTPKDLVEMMKISKTLGETLDHLPAEQRALMEQALGPRLANIDTAVKNSLPKAFQARYDGLRATYREVSGNLRKLTSGMDTAKSAVNFDDVASRVVEQFRATQFSNPTAEKATAHNILESLKIINPEAGKHLANLQLKNATMAFGGAKVASALSTSGVLARAASFGARKVALPAAMAMSKLQRRASLKGFLASGSGKRFMQASSLLKSGGDRVLNNPDLLGAGVTTMISALQDGEQ